MKPAASCLYEGSVTHRRFSPVDHGFRYRVQMAMLDLDELPGVLDRHPLWSARRPAPVRFRASDHLGGGGDLAESARDLVEQRTGTRHAGPVRLLTTLRFLGLGFNPVSFFYLHDRDGEEPVAAIAEVTNTPWRERTAYVLDGGLSGSFEKRMHVSPFMPMNQTYRWATTAPADALELSISSEQDGETVFAAGLALRRRELNPREMTRAMLAHPPAVLSTVGRIYWNALKLKLKGAPYFSKPEAPPASPAIPRD